MLLTHAQESHESKGKNNFVKIREIRGQKLNFFKGNALLLFYKKTTCLT